MLSLSRVIVLAMLVMMVKYAKFIHHYPREAEKDRSENPEGQADENGKTGPHG